ncbi:MAG: hypothetical protein ACXVXJ_13075, partial [Mycobacteriaceae bacterium]
TDYSVEFNALSAVGTIASSRLSSATFGLKAASETDDLAWKRFKADGKLTVTYDHFPNTPTSLTLLTPGGTAVGCGTSSSPVPINTGSWYARGNFTDADTGDQLTATFKYWSVSTGTLISIRNIGPQAQGQIQTALWGNPSVATYGSVYRWQAYSTDPSGQVSPIAPSATTYCYVRIDTTAPNPPVASATLNGVDTSLDGATTYSVQSGTAISFTFKPGGSVASDTYRYSWSVNSDTPGPELLPATATAGAIVSKSITFKASGPNTVRVWAYDQAGNRSAAAQFPFVASGSTPARWSLDEGTSPSANDASCVPSGSGPAPSAMTWVGPGVAPAPGQFGNALTLSGGTTVSDAVSSAVSPLSATDTQQYPAATTTAWVHIDPTALSASPFVPRTFLSIDGPSGSALTVGLALDSSPTPVPRFTAQLTNTGAVAPTTVLDNMDLNSDSWYEVAASVDYDSKQIQLVVRTDDAFGVTTSTTPATWTTAVPVQLTGVQRIGAAKTSAGALTGQWLGQVDELRTFRAAFTTNDGSLSSDLAQWMGTYPSQTPGAPLCS